MKKQNKQTHIEPSEDEIARTAYQIWENEGRPSGQELDHWLRAKTQMTEGKPPAGRQEPIAAASRDR